MNVDRALMYVVDGDALVLRRVTYHKRVPPESHSPMRVRIPLDPGEGLTARCAVENRAFNVADPSLQEGINVELARRIGMNPFALAPMTYRGKVLGVLGIDRGSGLGIIGDDELEVLQVFARQAAQTLETALVRAE
jgi:GAF domain-containing protein